MTKPFEEMNLNELLITLDRFFALQEDLENRIRIVQNIIFDKSAQMRNLRSRQR